MSFSQSTITAVSVQPDGRDLLIQWTSTSPARSIYQLYVSNQLVWYGQATQTTIPWPTGSNTPISIGVVDAADATTNFSSSLPAIPENSKLLTWEGGTYLALDIQGFHVYACDSPGGAVDYTKILADITAYPGGFITDGFGLGGFGHGGFGLSASNYSWQTPTLDNGTWTFAVDAYDTAGNQSNTPSTVTFTIAAAPRPPAANAEGIRLTYTYNPTNHEATLNWLASPG